ncbi:hypothetical protein [Adhaeribacter soli]|uniref:Uncharacterized protein n=1 Tax=Adhaeribacter soli TaxID=2607655 RepID=A0A5N1IRH2_9BACT|nr:hypothetical protein [Adhaeribacter soli]KAA9332694.1 hypothetical protein F0P94_11845 [Adhaeribacter soli]
MLNALENLRNDTNRRVYVLSDALSNLRKNRQNIKLIGMKIISEIPAGSQNKKAFPGFRKGFFILNSYRY